MESDITMTVGDAASMLTVALGSVALAKSGRPTLEAVRVHVVDGHLTFATTNSFVLTVATATAGVDADLDVLIPRDAAKAIVKTLSAHKAGIVRFTADRAEVLTDAGTGSTSFTPVGGTFPDYAQLIPPLQTENGTGSRFAVSPSYLGSMAALATKAKAVHLRVQAGESPSQPIRFDYKTDAFSVITVIMPMFATWEG